MPADLLLYALVAAGLIFWLRSILGSRHGDERQRPNPFAPSKPDPAESAKPALSALDNSILTPGETLIGGPLILPKNSNCTIANSALEPALLKIASMDRNFNLAHFMTGAQDAFVMIVEAFAQGDRDLLKSLLAPDLYKAFDQSLKERSAAGGTMTAEIHAIRKVEVTDAQLKDKMAFITLRFVADETVVTKDKDDHMLSGHPDRVTETIDIWTFARTIASKDPTWLLVATREEEASPVPVIDTTS